MTIAWAQIVIGALVVVGFFGSLAMLLFRPESFNDVNREPIMLMVGALIAAFSGLMGFFFGSSAGSARKTDLLARSGPQPADDSK
jgi:hypothetical protein